MGYIAPAFRRLLAIVLTVNFIIMAISSSPFAITVLSWIQKENTFEGTLGLSPATVIDFKLRKYFELGCDVVMNNNINSCKKYFNSSSVSSLIQN
jgi:hypothetical protein